MSVAEVLAGSRRWHVARADCLEFLHGLPADSCALVFGSPPYSAARTYGINFNRAGQVWVDWMVAVYQAALRACVGLVAFVVEGQTRKYRWTAEPALLMADLHRAGVNLRRPCIFHRVGIPGSGGPDYLRADTEFIVCATRPGQLPWSDNTACGHPPKWAPGGEMSHRLGDGTRVNQWGMNGKVGNRSDGKPFKQVGEFRPSHRFVKEGATCGHKNGDTLNEGVYVPPVLANPGNVISLKVGGGLMGSPLAHENEAPFPEDLAAFFIRSFCPPGGVCVDPFAGSGTTGAVAVRWGRRFVGGDIRPSQVALARRRLAGETPDLFEGREACHGDRPL